MPLPLTPPIAPQLARSREQLPDGDGWAYEPKWDGFRTIAFVDGHEIYLQSRGGKDLTRYFPEVTLPAGRYVIDGELLAESFGVLNQRIHPAESRINRLSKEIPARFIAFDLLAEDDELLLGLPYRERRARLESLTSRLGIELTPVAYDTAGAARWLDEEEGVVAKELDGAYRPGERKGMAKIKRLRTADAVLVGWRPGKAEGTVGALILGMYEPDGRLRVIGHNSGLKAKEKRELPAILAPFETGERGSGDPSRWTGNKDLEWVALRPELVVEVAYDQVSDGRIRHGTKLLRWRTDKAPAECTVDQLDN
ncbi:MAG: ATP-dependent DNA ligase [Baekduia sp.]